MSAINQIKENNVNANAYSRGARGELAQIACTSMLNGAYDANFLKNLSNFKQRVEAVWVEEGGPEFVAKLAVYTREHGNMKDTPAYLISLLAVRRPDLYEKVFDRVVDNVKMLRNHIKFIRSGEIDNRRSMPRAMRRRIRRFFEKSSNNYIFRQSVGNDPSMADVIKMIHPKPVSDKQEALFGYIIGRDYDFDKLPKLVQHYENFKSGKEKEIPNVPFQMVDSLGLDEKGWKKIAENASWNMTKKNLNTFKRHGIFEDPSLTKLIADRLAHEPTVKKSRVLPYEIMTACYYASGLPESVEKALYAALDASLANAPSFEGKTVVLFDTSGSMRSYKVLGGTMTASQVGAMIASAILHKNKDAMIVPFDTRVHRTHDVSGENSVLENIKALSKYGGGGTDIGAGFEYIQKNHPDADNIVLISDNESWSRGYYRRNDTIAAHAMRKIKETNENAKLAAIDLSPSNSFTQTPENDYTINIGGFSDVVFDVIAKFFKYGRDVDHWVETIDSFVDL